MVSDDAAGHLYSFTAHPSPVETTNDHVSPDQEYEVSRRGDIVGIRLLQITKRKTLSWKPHRLSTLVARMIL